MLYKYSGSRGIKWGYQIEFKGKVYKKMIGSKELARLAESKVLDQLRRQEFLGESTIQPITLAAFAESFIEYRKGLQLRSWKNDKGHIKVLSQFFIKPLHEITTKDLDDYIIRRRRDVTYRHGPVATATIVNELRTLSAVMNRAKDEGHVKVNVLHGYKFPKIDNFTNNFLDLPEIDRVIQASGPKMRPLIVTLLHTGARSGEACRAKRGDFDLNRKLWHIPAMNSKTKDARDVVLDDTVVAELSKLPRYSHGYMFENKIGRPYVQAHLRHGWDFVLKRAGIERKVRIHDLRHTYISWMVMNNSDEATIRQQVGHHSGAMLQRYSHLKDEHRQEEAQRFDKLLKSAGALKVVKKAR